MTLKKSMKGSLLVAILVLLSCGGGGSDDGAGATSPEAAILTFPDKDQECNQGDIISEKESRVTFRWEASAHTNSYTIVLKNLDTNVVTEEQTSINSIALTINRNVAYSWNVISRSDKTSTAATSETWMFYNAGEGVEGYAPFPAEVIIPTMGSQISSPVLLKWRGSDVDNDIDFYEVYLDTNNPPTTAQGTTTSTTLEDMALTAGTVYYWRIKTIDEIGSSSLSPVFEFRTE